MENKNKESNLEKRTGMSMRQKAMIPAIIITLGLLYLIPSIGARSLNYNTIKKYTASVEELKTQNSYREQFHELDKNLDGVIDSTEFIYRKK